MQRACLATYTDAMNLSKIGQISVTVHDSARATAFYKDTLGLRYLFSAGTLSFFDCQGVRLMLDVPRTPEYDHPGSVLYFTVDDITEAHATLMARGVAFKGAPHVVARMPDHELWMAFFGDTEGNTLALMSEVRG